MTSMRDIAEKAGVSIATVSMVLNKKESSIPISEARQKKILQIADELGYKPNYHARVLRMQKSNLIGVIVWDLTDQYYSLILKGIELELKQADYQVILTNADEDSEQVCDCFKNLEQFMVDGIIILGGSKPSIKEDKLMRDFKKPIINIGRFMESPEEDSVLIDNYFGGQKGAEYLNGLEKDKIVYIGKRVKTSDEGERLRGFIDSLENTSEYDVLEIESSPSSAFNCALSYLKDQEGSVAVFAEDDIIALGITRAARDLNRSIPAEVAVLGFDDLNFSEYMDPRLTTFRQPRLEMGIKGARMVVDRNRQKEQGEAKRILLKPELIIRDSA